MITLSLTEKGGETTVLKFDQAEVSIGRIQGNDVVLAKSNISKRHARIVNNDGNLVVIDAKSTNGTYINGKRIDAPYDLRAGDKVFVGDFTIEVAVENKKAPPPPPSHDVSEDAKEFEPGVTKSGVVGGAKDDILSDDEWGQDKNLQDDWQDDWGTEEPDNKSEDPNADVESAAFEAAAALAKPGRPTVDSDPLPTGVMPSPRAEAQRITGSRTASGAKKAPTAGRPTSTLSRAVSLSVRSSASAATAEIAAGLGPLEALWRDDSVTEIFVNGPRQIYVTRDGQLAPAEQTFQNEQAVASVIEHLVASLGPKVDAASPMLNARLKDGSRLNVVHPPLASRGPYLTLRRFTREPLLIDDLVAFGTVSAELANFLEVCVKARKTIVVAGGPGSGKTTTLNVLAGFIPAHERIITVEHDAELKLEQEHVVTLETRLDSPGGQGGVGVRELLGNALNMRPDRLVLGECRGGEALDLVQALNAGHEGALFAVHAHGAHDALSRLEAMALMGGESLARSAVRAALANAVTIIVQQARLADGSWRVTQVAEVMGLEDDTIALQDLFVFEPRGKDAEGRVKGGLRPTGVIPTFYEGLKAAGIQTDLAVFRGA